MAARAAGRYTSEYIELSFEPYDAPRTDCSQTQTLPEDLIYCHFPRGDQFTLLVGYPGQRSSFWVLGCVNGTVPINSNAKFVLKIVKVVFVRVGLALKAETHRHFEHSRLCYSLRHALHILLWSIC